MKVLSGDYVLLYDDNNETYTYCSWAKRCPRHNNKVISCEKCPARNHEIEVPYDKAFEWWKNAEIVNINEEKK